LAPFDLWAVAVTLYIPSNELRNPNFSVFSVLKVDFKFGVFLKKKETILLQKFAEKKQL
jgi:hypothetical protein